MAASFPNAKKTFSAVVNGVTKLVAALFNSPYDEIEAIETFIGATGGGAQSYYTSLTDMLINYRRGCAVEYKGDADLYVRAGEIMIVDASGNRRLRRNTSDTTVTWANIDTGSEATSTRYYVYACADNNATTFTVVVSTNATTPTGMTYYRLIGSFYNNASGNITYVANSTYSIEKKLGTWIDKSSDYGAQQAATDGFVVVNCGSSGTDGYAQGFTDSASDPTTLRISAYRNTDQQLGGNAGFSMPVKKGDYWKVVKTGTYTISVFWIPLA